MICVDVKKRYSVQQCLNDKWIKDNTIVEKCIPTSALNKIEHFNAKNKLKQAVITFIVSQTLS